MGVFLILYAPSTLVMDYAARFKFQVFLPLILCFILINENKKIDIFKYLIIIIFALVPLFHFTSYYRNTLFNGANNMLCKFTEIGKQLKNFQNDNYKILIGEAGTIPYYSDLCVYDYSGLANSYIARNGLTREYLNSEKIDIVFEYSVNTNKEFRNYLDSNYTKVYTFDVPSWASKFNIYFKSSEINNNKEKIQSFVCELDKINKYKFDIKKYLEQRYIFN